MISSSSQYKQSIGVRWIITSLVVLAWLSISSVAQAGSSVCAEVKIEIAQELTLERQAFDAHMRITNNLDTIAIENMDIKVFFTDETGVAVEASSDPNSTTASFFIRIDRLVGIADVGGFGVVQPGTVADVHWLIIPAPGSGGSNPAGNLYFVGATLNYTLGAEPQTTEVAPDFIRVTPQPLLTMDYFLTKDVNADDPFTPQIEPSEPFTLGVRIQNNGQGAARNVNIESAQPEIVDNEQGLLIGFEIVGSNINDQPATPSLTINFGDVDPGGSTVGRWLMTASLSGLFKDFTADFTHADELGGTLTSLLEATNAHILVHDVLVDLPGRDAVRDFLALDNSILRVYESDSVNTDVTDHSAVSTFVSAGVFGPDVIYHLTTPPTAGLMYVKFSDPFDGAKEIKEVLRSDGKRLSLNNAWFSKKRNKVSNTWDYFIHFFDVNTPGGTYKVTFSDIAASPKPPVLQFIPDRTASEGAQVSFIVEASDPNGTIPVLTASPLPVGANFIDQGNGTGIFDWTPAIGQGGTYTITYKASDGVLNATRTAKITVNSSNDTDGDGLPDDWERDHFGDLDQDGTTDFDNDGIPDIDELNNGTDPTVPNAGPKMPTIQSPLYGDEVAVLQPDLVIINSPHDPAVTVTYDFEVYRDAAMTDLVAGLLDVAETTTTTSWTVSSPLDDDTSYFWRVRGFDGYNYSLWANGRFFVNSANNAPGAFALSYPAINGVVDSLSPALSVTNSVDVDGDVLTYRFELFSDSGLLSPVTSVSGLATGGQGHTSWPVDVELSDGMEYFWLVTVTDEHGAETQSDVGVFFVNTANAAPGPLSLSSPLDGDEVTTTTLDLLVNNARDSDGDVLSYEFELDTVTTFDSVGKQLSGVISEGVDVTGWNVTGLVDNSVYYWRARAFDGTAYSLWVYGQFRVNSVNEAPSVPVLDNPDHLSWVETLKPVMSVNPSIDSDGDAIRYRFEIYSDETLVTLHESLLSDSTQVMLTLALNDLSRYYWRAQAEDEHGAMSAWSAVSSFMVIDNGINDVPEIAIPGDQTSVEGDSINLTISAFDFDGDVLSYSAVGLPISLAIDPSSGVISGVLGFADAGTYNVTVTVSDSLASVDALFTWTVTDSNTAPVLQLIAEQGVDEGTTLVVLVSASDAEGNNITFNAVGLPAFATLTDNFDGTAVLSIAPDFSDSATYAVTVTATDDGTPALSMNETFNIVVNDINQAPVLTAIDNQTLDEGATLDVLLSASDSDGDNVSFGASGMPGFVTLTDHLDGTATLSIAPGFADAGVYPVTVSVSDDVVPAASNEESFSISVNNINRAPSLNAIGNQSVDEAATLGLVLSASDADGDVLSFSASDLPTFAQLIDNNNGTASLIFTPGYSDAGSFTMSIIITDNGVPSLSDSAAFTLVVNNVNRAPVLSTIGSQSVDEAASLNVALSATDVDGNALAFSATGLPAFITLSDNNDGSASLAVNPGYDDAGSYPITVTVADNGAPALSASETFTLTVNNINRAPVADAGFDQSGYIGDTMILDGTLSEDPDSDTLSYQWSIISAPTGSSAAFADASAVKPQFVIDAHGSYTAQLIVNDGELDSAPQTVVITVLNRIPIANAGPDQGADESVEAIYSTVQLDGSASTDGDGDTVNYIWTFAVRPVGSTATLVNPISVSPFFVPDLVGQYSVELIVNDGFDNSAPDTVSINVVEPKPIITGEMQVKGKGRLLVLMDNEEDSKSYRGEASFIEQSVMLEAILLQSGWSFNIVTSVDIFTYEMRSGEYSAYAILSERQKLEELVQRELREAVYRSEGLLVAGRHDNRMEKLEAALGIKYEGKHSKATGLDVFVSEIYDFDEQLDFTLDEKVLRIELEGAHVVANYQIASKADDKKHDDNNAAITVFEYGQGTSVFSGLDLLAQATATGQGSLFATLLANALGVAHPDSLKPLVGSIVPVTIELTNERVSTPGRVVITLPDGMYVVDGSVPLTTTGNGAIWEFDILDGASLSMTFWVKLLDQPGTVTIEALVQSGEAFDLVDQATLNFDIEVEVSPTINEVIDETRLLMNQFPDEKVFKKVLEELEHADKELVKSKPEKALKELIKATDKLLGTSLLEGELLRLRIDLLVRSIEQSM